MRKYNKSCTAMKNKRKKSAPTYNQEVLVKVFQSQQQKEFGRGTKQLLIKRNANGPYRCTDSFDNTDDSDDNAATGSMPE
jgi:hypothetical protein